MNNKEFLKMTDEELLSEKKKMIKTKRFYAIAVGFLAGIILFGLGAWILLPKMNIGFLIPMLIPVIFIYQIMKAPNQYKGLEDVLKERKL